MDCITYVECIHGTPPAQVLTAYMRVPGTVVHMVVPLPHEAAAQGAEIQHVRRQLEAQLIHRRAAHETEESHHG